MVSINALQGIKFIVKINDICPSFLFNKNINLPTGDNAVISPWQINLISLQLSKQNPHRIQIVKDQFIDITTI
jgi:hypothetical protein